MIPEAELPTMVYIGGYSAAERLTCDICKDTFVDKSESCAEVLVDRSVAKYFTLVNHGGLTVPTSQLLSVLHVCFLLFSYILENGHDKA